MLGRSPPSQTRPLSHTHHLYLSLSLFIHTLFPHTPLSLATHTHLFSLSLFPQTPLSLSTSLLPHTPLSLATHTYFLSLFPHTHTLSFHTNTLSPAPKLLSVDTKQEANHSILVTWKLAYDGGSPITSFTITISPESPRSRRQEGGVIYHVDPSASSLRSGVLEGGRRYLVSLSLENSLGQQSYSLSGQ